MKIGDLHPKAIKDLLLLLSITIVIFMVTTAIFGTMYRDVSLERDTLRSEVGWLINTDAREREDLAAYAEKVEEFIGEHNCPCVPKYVTVEKGDWLSKYAKWYLGDAQRWPEIWELNPHIKDPDLIHPGQRVRIY